MNQDKKKVVIFDFDGVIIDSHNVMKYAFFESYKKIVGEHNNKKIAARFSEFSLYMGRGLIEILDIMQLPREMRDEFILLSHQLIKEIKVFPEIPDLLNTLWHHGFLLAIATGKERKRTLAILREKGLSEYFGHVFCCDDVAHPKPAPDMAIHIMEAFQVQPEETLMVGDAVADIQCARRAGIESALALWGNEAPYHSTIKPTFVLNNPNELYELLGIYEKVAVN